MPGRLRNFVRESRPCAPRSVRITEWMVHPARARSSLAIGSHNVQRTLQSGRAATAFIPFYFEVEQLTAYRESYHSPAVGNHALVSRSKNRYLPASRTP